MRSVSGGRGRALVMHLNPISISGGSSGRPRLWTRPFNDPEVVSLGRVFAHDV